MSKPMIHARKSAKKYGGTPEDYIDIHQQMDESKSHVADSRHRTLFHNSYGCFIMEKIFGVERKNSEDRAYSVRDIAEQHVLDDLGYIPSLERYLNAMELQPWMIYGKSMDDQVKKLLEETV